MSKLHFSYSTINMFYTNSHCWINKQSGVKQEDKSYFSEGKIAHSIIQAHVSGRKYDERISYLDCKFPITERYDFDPLCKFSFEIDGYEIVGFWDGKNIEEKRSLEIKTSSKPWTLKKFMDSNQRKIYSLADEKIEEALLITGSRNPDDWATFKLRQFAVKLTDRDRFEAEAWIRGGIAIFEAGDFTGGLTDGVCLDPYCPYGKNCIFKQNRL